MFYELKTLELSSALKKILDDEESLLKVYMETYNKNYGKPGKKKEGKKGGAGD